MIAEAEIRRLAARSGVDAMIEDLDYALGWFLAGLLRQPNLAAHTLFKGGTCLRKCYFPDYRFSEDLDFTLRRRVDIGELQLAVEAVQRWSQQYGASTNSAGKESTLSPFALRCRRSSQPRV